MYCVTIYNKKKHCDVGPAFFSGHGEKYKSLSDARKAAEDWLAQQNESEDLQIKDLQINAQIVGCL